MNKREATEKWVGEFDAIAYGMIERLMMYEPDDWHEVTTPSVGDRVYLFENLDVCCGEIICTFNTGEEVDGEVATEPMYEIQLDDEYKTCIYRPADAFEVEYDGYLPMWGTLWSFGDSADNYWLEELDGIRIMSECGFRIYESEEFGYFFGIDGAGYDFYEAHWIPLYEARGLRWHDRENQE